MTRSIVTTVLSVAVRLVRTRDGRKQKFDVQTSYRAPLHGGVFETWDPFVADSALTAAATGQPVQITYRGGRWADEIDGFERLEMAATRTA